MTGQLKHIENRRKDTVGPVGRMREVHRPYAAGAQPPQPASLLGVLPVPVARYSRATQIIQPE